MAAPAKAGDKWEGEDDEDDIKDAWDADSDKEGGEEGDPDAPKAIQRKKKKKLADILAEKEAAKAAEMEARKKEDDAMLASMTPEAKLAEKLRLQKIEENANLQLAKDMMGLKTEGVDAQNPVTKEEFQEFERALTEKITGQASSKHYPDLIEGLVKNISLDLNASTIKKIKLNLDALHSTKLKEEKAAKAKAAKSKKVGGSLRMDTNKVHHNKRN